MTTPAMNCSDSGKSRHVTLGKKADQRVLNSSTVRTFGHELAATALVDDSGEQRISTALEVVIKIVVDVALRRG